MSGLSEKDKTTLRQLVAESVSDGLGPEDQAQLNALLQGNRAAQDYYIECLGLYVDLHDLAQSRGVLNSTSVNSVRTVSQPRGWRLAAWASVAALVILSVWLLWQHATPGPEIGTLVDALDVQANWSFPKRPGQRWHLGQGKVRLKAGIAHLHLDQGVDLIVEAPCALRMISPAKLALRRGRVYVQVAEAGHGFTIETLDTDIVDLGTEFGVVSYGDQGAEIHVIRGEVEVRKTASPAITTTESLAAGHALRIDSRGAMRRDVPCDTEAFIRRIDSKAHLAWRGQDTLDLADVVAGGDGFGSGQPGYEIEPLTGTFRPIETEAHDRQGNHQYQSVAALPFVDGVFVPDGSAGPVQITSSGHEFQECPDTCNIFFSELLGCSTALKGEIGGRRRGLVLDGVEYATERRPGIFMHANLGITFDLRAIRASLGPPLSIERFQTIAGISEDTNVPQVGDMDLWVLIDGHVVYTRRNIRVGQAQPIDLPIGSAAEFLTLIATDSRSNNLNYVDTFADWCSFGEPRLILQVNEADTPILNP